jgi:phosphoribosyl-AMP cyclohydrolase
VTASEEGHEMTQRDAQAQAQWRTSSFSNGESTDATCVEVATLTDGRIAVRNSNHSDAGAVYFTRAEMDAWIKGVKAGEFDHLA